MTAASTARQAVAEAAVVLSRLGLVTAFGHVSARFGESMLITPGTDLATVSEDGIVPVPIAATSLPTAAPAEAWVHLAIYRGRPDVAAVARAQPPGTFAVAASTKELKPVHGQAAWLGTSVPVHDDARLLRSAELAGAAAARLSAGNALLLRGNGAITVGAEPGIAVARMWLLAAACDIWMGNPPGRTSTTLRRDEISAWQAVQDELLPRLWHHLLRRASAAQPVTGHDTDWSLA